jgi:hypothetical protein
MMLQGSLRRRSSVSCGIWQTGNIISRRIALNRDEYECSCIVGRPIGYTRWRCRAIRAWKGGLQPSDILRRCGPVLALKDFVWTLGRHGTQCSTARSKSTCISICVFDWTTTQCCERKCTQLVGQTGEKWHRQLLLRMSFTKIVYTMFTPTGPHRPDYWFGSGMTGLAANRVCTAWKPVPCRLVRLAELSWSTRYGQLEMPPPASIPRNQQC